MSNNLELDFSRAQIICMIGSCGAGKSYLLRNLIYQFQKKNVFKFGVCFSGTGFNSDYNFLPEGAVRSNYSEDQLAKYIEN